MKSNFGKEIRPTKTGITDKEHEFEQMLIKAGAKGSYLVFANFFESDIPKHLRAIDRNAKETLLPVWLKNFRVNLERRLASINWQTTVDDRRALIVGAGPSLKKQYGILQRGARIPNDVDVFCADRAFNTLRDLMCSTKYIVTVDADDKVADYYEQPASEMPYPISLLPVTCSPKVQPQGQKRWYIPSIDEQTDKIMQLMTGLPVITSGGNVNSACCAIAEYLGYKELILVGFDFAYELTEKGITTQTGDQTEDYEYWFNAFKSTGASDETIQKAYTTIEHPHFKTRCLSDIVFTAYRTAFYSWLDKTKCKVTNATEGGALIHNKLEYKRLEEILDK